MSFCQFIFPGVRSFLVLSSFGFSFLPLAFSLILVVASRLLHPYSTNNKTSRLMVTRFSTVRDTQRFSQSYMEKRRGRREIEVTRTGRRGIKGGESSLASNQFPMCCPESGPLTRGSRSYIEKRRGRKEVEVTRRRSRGVKRKETDLASNQFPKCSPQPRTHKEIHRVRQRREAGGRRQR